MTRLQSLAEAVKYEIRTAADAAHTQHPQYRGHWDGPEWVIIEVKRDIKTKMGRAFHRGELALARKEALDGRDVWCAYSRANKCDTVIGLDKATEVTS